jgi:hypothetical protein
MRFNDIHDQSEPEFEHDEYEDMTPLGVIPTALIIIGCLILFAGIIFSIYINL